MQTPLLSSSRFPLDAETANIWSTEYAICVQQFPPRLRKIQIPDPRGQFQGEKGNCGRELPPPPLPSLFVIASHDHWLRLWGRSRPSDHPRPLSAMTRTGRQREQSNSFHSNRQLPRPFLHRRSRPSIPSTSATGREQGLGRRCDLPYGKEQAACKLSAATWAGKDR